MNEYTPDAWFDLLGDLSLEDCRVAAAAVGKRQPFIAPAEIRAEVRRVRRDRIDRAIPAAPPAEVADAPGDPENPLSNAAVLAKAQRVMQAAGHGSQPVTALIQACADLPHAASLEGLWRALHQLRWA
jgi:hypothetical protein